MLHETGSRGRSINRGGSSHGLRTLALEAKAQKLQLAAENARANLARERAHLLRMHASDDTKTAEADLDRVYSLDKQLMAIKRQAAIARKGFSTASKEIAASYGAKTQLLEDAARVTAKIKKLNEQIAKKMKGSQEDKLKAAEDRDAEDEERETLASALVQRTRREKNVEEGRRELDKMQKSFDAADKAAKLKLKTSEDGYTAARRDLQRLEAKYGDAKGGKLAHARAHAAAHKLKAPKTLLHSTSKRKHEGKQAHKAASRSRKTVVAPKGKGGVV